MINHIPGKLAITGKDFLADNYISYIQKHAKKSEICSFNKTFPVMYRLYNEGECRDFFELLL